MGLPAGRQTPPLFLGVVHLLPLPGAPTRSPGLDGVLERALRDVDALVQGGVDGLIVENLGDAPYVAEQVEPWTVAALTRVAGAVRERAPDVLLGVNVLRNDALAALGVACAVGADFIRVNVHVGTMVTDQGLVTGRARETLLARQRLGADVAIAADVLVKHAAPLGQADAAQVARDTLHRGRADALIVTGTGTGRPIDRERLATVRAAVPGAAVWAGSGLTPASAPALRTELDGAIVGTWLHEDADLSRPLDADRVREMGDALRG